MAKRSQGGTPGLISELRRLPATGSGSFEALVRDLLSRATGRRFTLTRSGPQQGSDMRSAEAAGEIVISVEAKRYAARTPLPLDETKSKLRDATDSEPGLDCWVLIASREVKEPDRTALIKEGQARGVEVLILDWPESAELLPPLLLLAASAEDLLFSYVAQSAGIVSALRKARSHATYQDQLGKLKSRLLEPELGYPNARDRAAEHIRQSMGSMTAAGARIGRYTNLTDPAVVRVARPELRRAISAWWDETPRKPLLALLGGEGLGKTWAALGWWLDRELSGTPLPLTLVVPARKLVDSTAEAVIGMALHQLFAIHNAAWWVRRARRWCAGADGVRLLLIVDGLNERFHGVDYARLAAELALEPWQATSVIYTDRPDHWRKVVGDLQSAELSYAEQPVGPFEDGELDDLLGRAGLQRDKLEPALVALMRTPRLCALAIRHWEKLERSRDITPERLIYEDFRERIYPGLDDSELRNLVASIGWNVVTAGRLDATLLRRQIVETVAKESGIAPEEATVSAIVSGSWFEPLPGETHRFRVNPELAPMAIGLALAQALQDSRTREDAALRMQAFVDDLRDLELGVTVVGIAACFATIWSKATSISRDLLLDTWLASANFAKGELDRYKRVIAEEPEFFLDRTEAVWRDRQRLADDRNIHLAGIVNASEGYSSVLAAFVRRATLWLSETWGWRDVVNGTEPPIEIAAASVRARVETWNEARGALPPLLFIAEPDEDWVSLAGTTIGAISYLRRAPFAPAIANHAAAHVLMGEVVKPDRFEWLLRGNTEDPEAAEAVLIEYSRALAAVSAPQSARAADFLLEALCTPNPAGRPAAPRSAPRRDDTARLGEDGILRWACVPDTRCSGWGIRALRYACDLAMHAEDPDARLDRAGVELLREVFCDFLADHAEHRVLHESTRAVIARWAPDLLLRYLADPPSPHAAHPRSSTAFDAWKASWVAHDEPMRARIVSAFEAALQVHRDGGDLSADLVALALAGEPAAAQLDAFLRMPHGPRWPEKHSKLLSPLTESEFHRLEPALDLEREPSVLRSWLNLLALAGGLPPGFEPVGHLMHHLDEDIRATAMRVASRAEDKALCNRLRDSGWSASNADGQEAAEGSVVLSVAEPVQGEDRPARILSVALGCLWRSWPDEESFAEAFAAHVESRVRAELGLSQSSGGFGYRFDDELSYRRLVESGPERVENWIAPALQGARVRIGHMMFSADQAVVEVCRALLWFGRPAGADLLRALLEQLDQSSIRPDNLLVMPFKIPLNQPIAELRIEMLTKANLDIHLQDFAWALQRGGEAGWLVGQIRSLAAGTTLQMCRALVLAGELDEGGEADALWDELRLIDLRGWLDDVRSVAFDLYTSNVHARRWLRLFTETSDPIAAFSAFELFRRTATATVGHWAPKMMDEAKPHICDRAYQHWVFNVPGLNDAVKARRKDSGQRLAYTTVPRHDQAPWH